MARFVMPIQSAFLDNGLAGLGWRLNFYVSGAGFVRKDTFSDDVLTVANLNPVVADSAGRFGNIFLESGTYKVVLEDALAVQKWTADPVDGATGAAGAVLAPQTGNHTVTVDELGKVLPVDATTGPITITLTAIAQAANGSEFTIVKTDSSANAVTVDGNAAELVGGAANQLLRYEGSSITVRSDGTEWLVIPRTQEILGAFGLSGVLSPAQITADQNDYDPTGLSGAAVLRLDTDASRTITGLAGGSDGRVVVIQNVGANDLTLADEDVLSLAANRFALVRPVLLVADDVAVLQYDGTSSRWRSVSTPIPVATDTLLGGLETATQAEMETATATDKTVTPGRVHFHPGVAKAWATINEQGGAPPPIQQSYNASSTTDGGSGSTTINWSITLSSGNAAVTGLAQGLHIAISTRTTTSTRVLSHTLGTATLSDAAWKSAVVFGDL